MRGAATLALIRVPDRLAVRLAILLTVALLPLGIVAIVTTLDSLRSDLKSAERALISLTADREAGRRALVESALATARALAQPTLERLDDPEGCRNMMAEIVRTAGIYSFVGFTGTDGMMECVSQGAPLDFSDSALFRRMVDEPGTLVRRSEAGASSGRPVLIATRPVFDDSALRGFLSVTISLESFRWLRWDHQEDTGMHPILFNRLGDVLSMGGLDDIGGLLPEGRTLADLAGRGGKVLAGRTEAGDRAVFAVVELVSGQLYVLGVWPPDEGPVAALAARSWPLAFPLIMWLASIAVVYFALDFLVIRHLRDMGGQMRRFALGDRGAQQPLPAGVPHELREVHGIFQKMALLVARDEAELSAALAEKDRMLRERTVLLKEVHHRVKNNLQLIASILNLQGRRLADPRIRRVLQNVQDRVISLATIHRNLYRSEHLSEVRVDQLIEESLRHLFAVGTEAGSGIDLRTDLAPVSLPPEQVVPLSLLLTEAVTNALKHCGIPEGADRSWIRVSLAAADGAVTLTVANSTPAGAAVAPEEDDISSTRLGSELITAFANQLGARLEHGPLQLDDGPAWQVRLSFRLEPQGAADASG